MLAKGANAQRHEFGSKLWHLLLQIAKHRRVYCVFVYSHCGFGQQDLADALAEAARIADPTTVKQHPLWSVDVARAQVRPDIKALADELDEAHKHPDSFRSVHRDSARAPLLKLPREQHETLYRLRLGCDARVGGFFHSKGKRASICPLPGCDCPIDREGHFLDAQQLRQQDAQRARVAAARRRNSDNDVIDLGGPAVVEHGVSHFFRCPAPAAVAARKRAGLPDGCDGSVLWDPTHYAAVLRYHAWFAEARLALSSGGVIAADGTVRRGGGAAQIWPRGVDLVKGWTRRNAPQQQQQQQQQQPAAGRQL
jgi:hypothetical protein